MATPVIQTAFAAGEFSPSLYGEVDLAKYHSAAALLRNFYVDYRGGASTRPGTMYVGTAADSGNRVRLIRFQFSTSQSYILEFGQFYMRVIKNGAYVLEAAKSVTAITQANPGVVTSAAHGFANGDSVYTLNIGGMTALNGKTFIVAGATTNTFTLKDLYGNALDTSAYPAYTSGGTFSRIYTLSSPYAAVDLALLKFTQNKDAMTLTHTSYVSNDLIRYGDANWAFVPDTFSSNVSPPTSAAATGGSGAFTYQYVVTALDANGYEESVASNIASCVNKDLNQTAAAYTGNTISWIAPSGTIGLYKIYKASPYQTTAGAVTTQFGYIGQTTNLNFADANIGADFTRGPPAHRNPFASGNNPGVVTYFQQRRMFAGSILNPDTLWGSQVALFKNMDVHDPVRDDDAVTYSLNSEYVNVIKNMVSMTSGLVVLTGDGAWLVSGGGNNQAITPSNVIAQPQAYNGCNDMPPIVVNYDILYVQQKGAKVRDLAYNFYANVFTGSDLSVLSNHLFEGYTLQEWAYAEEPYKLIQVIRNDGVLLTFTYLKEQDVYAWTHSDTQGIYESVATIGEGNVNAIYFVVRRYVNGQWLRYIERQDDRQLNGEIENAWCVDAGLRYPLFYPAANLTLSAYTGFVTVTADSAVFAVGDVGKVLRACGGKGVVTGYLSSTQLTVSLYQDISQIVPNDPNNMPLPAVQGAWSLTAPVTQISGLDHLEGKQVSILADGNVQTPQTVHQGAITLQHAASAITIGLGYQCQLQTLAIDTGNPTIQSKRKTIPAVTARVDNARGLKMGHTFDDLTLFKEQQLDGAFYGQAIPLQTGDQRVITGSDWDEQGQMCFQVDDPTPATILAIIPEVVVGDGE